MGGASSHIVYIEGNIGAGKSELLDGLSARGYTVVKEAIEEDWTLFEKAKKDPTRWVPSFQLQVTLSIAERIESALKNHWGPWPIIVERSIVSAYLFARVAGRCGNLSDTEIELIRRFSLRLNSGFDWYSTKTIMLDCPSELCLERIKERGRAGEEATSIDYLTMVEDEHINAMDSTWNHVDATKDKDTVLEAVLSMV